MIATIATRRVGRKSKDTRHAGQEHRDGSDIYAPCVVWGRFCAAALTEPGCVTREPIDETVLPRFDSNHQLLGQLRY